MPTNTTVNVHCNKKITAQAKSSTVMIDHPSKQEVEELKKRMDCITIPLTQDEYDALPEKRTDVIYWIYEES